jgi:DNA-binding MarR family transcriptional regulator
VTSDVPASAGAVAADGITADGYEDLTAEAWRRIRSISDDPATVALCHQIMHESGLTGTTLRALSFLPLTGSLPMRELASRMGCDNSYVTSLVDSLEQLGLAGRQSHPTDRRRKVIVLTEQGRQVAGRVHRAYTTPPAAFAALSDTEVTTLCDLLRKLDPAGA